MNRKTIFEILKFRFIKKKYAAVFNLDLINVLNRIGMS